MAVSEALDAESVERAIIAFLRQVDPTIDDVDLSGLDLAAASDRSAEVGPMHGFVFCRDLAHQAGGLYRAEIAVTLVTNIEDESNRERAAWRTKLGTRLHAAKSYRNFVEDHTGVQCHGWQVTGPNEISEPGGISTGDVWVLLAGLRRVSPANG